MTNGPLPISRVAPLDQLLPLSVGSSGWFSQYMSYEDSNDFLSDNCSILVYAGHPFAGNLLPTGDEHSMFYIALAASCCHHPHDRDSYRVHWLGNCIYLTVVPGLLGSHILLRPVICVWMTRPPVFCEKSYYSQFFGQQSHCCCHHPHDRDSYRVS